MKRHLLPVVTGALIAQAAFAQAPSAPGPENAPARRIVILKVDGLNADVLYRAMRQIDPATGKSVLPWFSHIFAEQGTIFENFYTRGISLSAPSWSMLDTGRHGVIRGNVEYDRYTGHTYDYLNFFPFYIEYARSRHVDMPGVEVLDRTGIPLIIDSYPYAQRFQGFQLFQRGVRWTTLEHVLEKKFSSKALFSMLESSVSPSLDAMLSDETEDELKSALKQPEIFYLDFFTGDIDHIGHASNEPGALIKALKRVDEIAGRVWTVMQASPLASQTLLAVVSDHGMNNAAGIISQTFSLPDLLNSAAGGAHHVVTNREQLSDYKLRGLNPLVHRAITPSSVSFYLPGEASRYPTAWLDIDGNERAALQLRNSDLNKIHILLLQLARTDLSQTVRQAAAEYFCEIIDRHRQSWRKTLSRLDIDISALTAAIEQRKKIVEAEPKKWTPEERDLGQDKAGRRLSDELEAWLHERSEYQSYAAHLTSLLAVQPSTEHPLKQKISELVPEMSLGDANSIWDLQHYVAGPSGQGLVAGPDGKLDEESSFRYVDYLALLSEQRARNNPQPALTNLPIDFSMLALPPGSYSRDPAVQNAYWLYGDEHSQILILTGRDGRICVKPVQNLKQDRAGNVSSVDQSWRVGLPLHLFEDPNLQIPSGTDADTWLSSWHTEREWLEATHMCRYSDAVISVTEGLSPIAENVPGPPGMSAALLDYERLRRELVQPDLEIFAADHWNFNVRFPNPGGNHGSFLRISTHSVWMMAGAGVPNKSIEAPYDSLNFASTLLSLLGRTPPMPDRVVDLK